MHPSVFVVLGTVTASVILLFLNRHKFREGDVYEAHESVNMSRFDGPSNDGNCITAQKAGADSRYGADGSFDAARSLDVPLPAFTMRRDGLFIKLSPMDPLVPLQGRASDVERGGVSAKEDPQDDEQG